MPRRGRRTAATVLVVGLGLAACGDDDASDGSGAEPGEEEVVLEDDFSDASSGFTVSSSESGSLAYVDGAYVIDALGVNSLKVSDTDLDGEAFTDSVVDLGDVRVEVDVEKAVEEGPAVFGVLCRLDVDEPGYYGAFVDADGYWRITKFAGSSRTLAEADAETTIGGMGADGGNRLSFECFDEPNGTRLRLAVDGEVVGSVKDPSPLPAGRVAMAAGPRGEAVRGSARFDDLTITALP